MDKIQEKALRKMMLRNYAIRCGTVLGGVWLVRFIVFLLGLNYPLVMTVFIGSVFVVPMLLVAFTRNYRDIAWQGRLSFIDALQLCLLMCFYASLMMAAVHYVYYRFLDHGYVADAYETMGNMLKQLPEATEMGLGESFDAMVALWVNMTPIDIALQMMSNNLFWGVIMSIPIALFLYRKPQQNKD